MNQDIKLYLLSLGYQIDDSNNHPCLRFDVHPEQTSKENWSVFIDIQSDLREVGFEMREPNIEHDCVSGYIYGIESEELNG